MYILDDQWNSNDNSFFFTHSDFLSLLINKYLHLSLLFLFCFILSFSSLKSVGKKKWKTPKL